MTELTFLRHRARNRIPMKKKIVLKSFSYYSACEGPGGAGRRPGQEGRGVRQDLGLRDREGLLAGDPARPRALQPGGTASIPGRSKVKCVS